ncbi:IS5 family transposase [Streptantibioticus parmotrematis]|uniref:IS5 family transposase n=1 Tax=Streptantibioticus parmotrematis TaxID=2873249 RepID=UPI0033D32381
MTRVQLPDAEWQFIEPYLPVGEYGPYPERLRQQFEGVIWHFKSGSQWRETPREFGAWSTVHNRFRQWRDAGAFEALLEGAISEAAKRGEVDLSLAKGGGPPEQDGQAPEREERRRIRRRRRIRLKAPPLGGARDGQTSKAHVAGERKCRPLVFVMTKGQAADSPQFITVLEKVRVRGTIGRPRTRPDAVAGDKAYSSRGNRAYLSKRRIKAVIPEKVDQSANRRKKGSLGGRPVGHDAELHKDRNTVERLINKLRAWRGRATRYDKSPTSYLAGLHLRGAMTWIKDLTRAAA